MKKELKLEMVYLTYDELLNCKNVKTNRCGYTTKEEAFKNGFSSADWDKFMKRAEKIKKTIKKNGFSNASFFVIAKDNEDNFYLLDGQGRRMALKLMCENDNFDFSTWKYACILFVEPMTIEEMGKLIIDLNTGNTNWQTKDIRRSDAILSDDENVKEAYRYTKELMDKYELTDYVVNLFTYGERASHQRNGVSHPFSTKDYATTKEIFTEAYLRFINYASVRLDSNGNYVKRSSDVRKKIRNTTFAISFNSCLRGIVEQNGRNVEKAKDDIFYFVDKLIDASSGDDAFMKQFVNCEKKDKYVVANKVKKFCKRNTVKLALYSC